MQEMNQGPAYDEIRHVLTGLDIESTQVQRAGDVLCEFIEGASALIAAFAACSEVKNPEGLLADAVRKFDIRVPLNLLSDLNEIPGLQQLIQRYQTQLGALRSF